MTDQKSIGGAILFLGIIALLMVLYLGSCSGGNFIVSCVTGNECKTGKEDE